MLGKNATARAFPTNRNSVIQLSSAQTLRCHQSMHMLTTGRETQQKRQHVSWTIQLTRLSHIIHPTLRQASFHGFGNSPPGAIYAPILRPERHALQNTSRSKSPASTLPLLPQGPSYTLHKSALEESSSQIYN